MGTEADGQAVQLLEDAGVVGLLEERAAKGLVAGPVVVAGVRLQVQRRDRLVQPDGQRQVVRRTLLSDGVAAQAAVD